MANLAACDPEIFENGETAFVCSTGGVGGSEVCEDWVQALATESRQRIDWHCTGGRAIVRFIGDLGAIRAAHKTVTTPSAITILWENVSAGRGAGTR